jgi:hypothetical protein
MEKEMNAPSPTAPASYNIFFSNKAGDEAITRKIIDLFHRHTDNVQCFTSEDIEKGKNWRDEIAQHLKLSSLLVLIFTDPEEDWGWALYETGFFDALSQIPDAKQARRIYCLYNESNTPPSPIANLRTIVAEPEDVSRWLRELFEYTKQTNTAFINDIPEIADQICRLFPRKQRNSFLVPSLTIFLEDAISPSRDSVLSSKIKSNNYTLRLLNLREGQWTLKDVEQAQSDRLWFNELIDNVVTLANNTLRTLPVKHALHTADGDYIPTINWLRQRDAQLTLSVELVELPKEGGAFFGRPIPSNRWPQIFVAMPFLKEMNPIYEDQITNVVVNKIKKTVGRADNFYTDHEIMKDVWSAIYFCEAVIADCTGRNPNVFYEIGIAHTLGKKTILIAQKIDDIPFDVRHIRNIIYENTARGAKELERILEDILCNLIE